MPINSRNKGAVGERELSAYLAERGFPARRGQQFKGGGDSPDVQCEGLARFHIECKRVEKGNPYEWFEQAKRDGVGKIPVVMHRKNRKDWLVVMRLDDFLQLEICRPL